MIEEIKDYEDTDDMLIAKKIEDVKRWTQQEKEYIIKNLTDEELWQEIERKKSLHKKMPRQCQSCRKLTDDWVEMDLDMLECRECYEANNEWGESLAKNAEKNRIKQGEEKPVWVIKREEKEKKNCYDWCADDCPQQFSKSKKEK